MTGNLNYRLIQVAFNFYKRGKRPNMLRIKKMLNNDEIDTFNVLVKEYEAKYENVEKTVAFGSAVGMCDLCGGPTRRRDLENVADTHISMCKYCKENHKEAA